MNTRLCLLFLIFISTASIFQSSYSLIIDENIYSVIAVIAANIQVYHLTSDQVDRQSPLLAVLACFPDK